MNHRLLLRRKALVGLQSVSLAYSASLASDRIHQTEAVALQRDYVVPLAYESGEYDGLFLPMQYLCDYRVEGKPFYSTLRGETEWLARTSSISHHITAGGEFLLNKNYGRGQISILPSHFTPLQPADHGHIRTYQPQISSLSTAEDKATMPIGKHQLTVMAGLVLPKC